MERAKANRYTSQNLRTINLHCFWNAFFASIVLYWLITGLYKFSLIYKFQCVSHQCLTSQCLWQSPLEAFSEARGAPGALFWLFWFQRDSGQNRLDGFKLRVSVFSLHWQEYYSILQLKLSLWRVNYDCWQWPYIQMKD